MLPLDHRSSWLIFPGEVQLIDCRSEGSGLPDEVFLWGVGARIVGGAACFRPQLAVK